MSEDKTTLLTAKADRLQEKVSTLENKKSRAGQRKDFEGRRQTLKSVRDDLKPLAKKRVLFASSGIPCEHEGKGIRTSIDEWREVRDRFEEDPDWVINTDLRNCILDRIRGHRSPSQRSLDAAWRNYYEEKNTRISEDLLSALEEVDGFEAEVQKIQNLSSKVSQWEHQPPSSQSGLDRFEKRASALQEAWKRIEEQDLSPEVKAFLSATVSGGAPLKLVTTEVREWLEEHDLLDRATVSL
jgi:polyhydroxyalkanoate synthesis regulator phasin